MELAAVAAILVGAGAAIVVFTLMRWLMALVLWRRFECSLPPSRSNCSDPLACPSPSLSRRIAIIFVRRGHRTITRVTATPFRVESKKRKADCFDDRSHAPHMPAVCVFASLSFCLNTGQRRKTRRCHWYRQLRTHPEALQGAQRRQGDGPTPERHAVRGYCPHRYRQGAVSKRLGRVPQFYRGGRHAARLFCRPRNPG